MNCDVVIMGGGIGGLSTAHELRRLNYRGSILVIERNSELGGLARSKYIDGLPAEYSWRVYGPNYTTLRRIMSEIPDGKTTVANNLVDIENYLLVRSSGSFTINYNLSSAIAYGKHLSFRSIYKLLGKFSNLLMSCQRRIYQQYSDIAWIGYINPENDNELDLIVRSIGPYLGVDIYKASTSSVWQILEDSSSGGKLSVMNGPTNDKWFDPWSSIYFQRMLTLLRMQQFLMYL